jgi:hypothetical protein
VEKESPPQYPSDAQPQIASDVDKQTLRRLLIEAEHQIAAGEIFLERQQSIISSLKRDGYTIRDAIRFYERLKISQRRLVAERNNLMKKIEESSDQVDVAAGEPVAPAS